MPSARNTQSVNLGSGDGLDSTEVGVDLNDGVGAIDQLVDLGQAALAANDVGAQVVADTVIQVDHVVGAARREAAAVTEHRA